MVDLDVAACVEVVPANCMSRARSTAGNVWSRLQRAIPIRVRIVRSQFRMKSCENGCLALDVRRNKVNHVTSGDPPKISGVFSVFSALISHQASVITEYSNGYLVIDRVIQISFFIHSKRLSSVHSRCCIANEGSMMLRCG
jgi:hypothetical protein